MWPRPTAVADHLLVVAAGVHQGVGQDRHAVKCPVLVDAASECNDIVLTPIRLEQDGTG